MRGLRKGYVMMVTLAILSMFFIGSVRISEAAPEGVLKQGIHWGISADWLDPATAGYTVSANLPLYLFHDALMKPMPDGWYSPCLAESYTVSPDAKVYEFKLRQGSEVSQWGHHDG